MKSRMDLRIGNHTLKLQFEEQGSYEKNEEHAAKTLAAVLRSSLRPHLGLDLLEHTVVEERVVE